MIKLPIFIVDSFTKTPFSGNPAAVCVLSKDHKLTDVHFQKIATEMNLSETAFVVPLDKPNMFHLRWFTPTIEVALCGHATLATAHVLLNEQGINAELLSFQTLSGLLTVQKTQDGMLQMNFPQGDPKKIQLEKSILEQICTHLPLSMDSIIDMQHCTKTKKLLIEVNNTEAVSKLSPSFDKLLSIDFGPNLNPTMRGIIVTCKGKEYDFISRYFAPWNGINEDPVTGSAHTGTFHQKVI